MNTAGILYNNMQISVFIVANSLNAREVFLQMNEKDSDGGEMVSSFNRTKLEAEIFDKIPR